MPGCDKCPTEYLCSKCAGNLILHDGAIVSKCVKTCPRAHNMVIKNGVKVCKLEGWYILYIYILVEDGDGDNYDDADNDDGEFGMMMAIMMLMMMHSDDDDENDNKW